ncbi:MAG TPA: PIN domain nuclease [Lentisphaeria bacterium]|nr:MAG: hypothetical protein A2X47_08420 [Lentisphaerae bacterium GWF2_38_69]HBM15817.1 PIN domain nuclease [Lentisphaeria bacterium]
MILLDTCALLWLDSNRELFSIETLDLLNRYSDALAVSPVTFMEIGIKAKKGRLELPIAFDKWTDEICSQYSLTILPVTKSIAVYTAELPEIHRDPFDRIIIATAAINNMKIVTADKIFTEYKNIKVIW